MVCTCFCAVPAGATKLAFTFLNSATFDFVLLTTSESVEAIEPDWVEHTECLGGAYEAYLIDDVLRSVSGVSSVGTISQAQLSNTPRTGAKVSSCSTGRCTRTRVTCISLNTVIPIRREFADMEQIITRK